MEVAIPVIFRRYPFQTGPVVDAALMVNTGSVFVIRDLSGMLINYMGWIVLTAMPITGSSYFSRTVACRLMKFIPTSYVTVRDAPL